MTFRFPALLMLLAAGSLFTPLAAASVSAEVSAPEADYSCGQVLEVGVVPWTVCQVYAAGTITHAVACLGWRIVWGPANPCPLPIPL